MRQKSDNIIRQDKEKVRMFQASTLQALLKGYTRTVISVGELVEHGDTGLGTFEDVNGEMIVLDGVCYRADSDGNVSVVKHEDGVSFAAVAKTARGRLFELENINSMDELKTELNNKIDETFGLNSMHVLRIDAEFSRINARSEEPYRSHHIDLSEILSTTQTDFTFTDKKGTIVALYFPDYMDGINASGWHFHFVSADKKLGGHVFDLAFKKGQAKIDRISKIELQMPTGPDFDTYSLKDIDEQEVKKVEG